MEILHPTTSFGRRSASLGQLATQAAARRAVAEAAKPGSNAPAAVDKWRLFRILSEVREQLGVSDRSLSVLNALLSFHPETALTLPRADGGDLEDEAADNGLVVFPSNHALARRAHGMAGTTLWRHLTALVSAGLILRRDSPNGKRYARKDEDGGERFVAVFGFDLAPLVARAAEFEAMAERARRQERERRLAKERISLLRRDVTKLVGLGLDQALPGNWDELRRRAMGLMAPLRSLRAADELAALEAALVTLRADTAKLLESHIDAPNMRSNDNHGDAHQSNSKPEPNHDLEPASIEEGARAALLPTPGSPSDMETKGAPSPLPLGLVLEACPDLHDYAPDGHVGSWSDLLDAAANIRPMLGISPDAWRDALAALGRIEAHIAVAAILQRSVHSSEADRGPQAAVNGSPAIRAPGGYLRALSDKARAGRFSLGPMLMATIGQRAKAKAMATREGRARDASGAA